MAQGSVGSPGNSSVFPAQRPEWGGSKAAVGPGAPPFLITTVSPG